MAELTVQYPDKLLQASGKSRGDLEQELKFQLAVRLFDVGELSLGQAAEVAGLPKVRFMDELGRLKIPIIRLEGEELEAELNAVRGTDRR